MISRRTTQALAAVFCERFVTFRSGRHGGHHSLDVERLYNFLYANDYEPYFMNLAKGLVGGPRALVEFVLRLHTGETIQKATPEWDWKRRRALGNRLLRDLAEDILQAGSPDHYESAATTGRRQKVEGDLIRNLELDGYRFENNRLLFSEAAVLDTEEEEGLLHRLIREVGLPDLATPEHHLSKTAEHYMAGRWDDCIGNARKVLESVLSQVALVHSTRVGKAALPPQKLERPFEVRDYLERERLLESKEKKALAEVYGLLSNTGGHPYIAEKDQARLMRHLALTFTQFALLRLQGALQSASSEWTP